MIKLTKLYGDKIVLNMDYIKHLTAAPDTTITLCTNETLMVLETVDEVVERCLEYRRQFGPPRLTVALDKHFPLRLPSGRLWEEVAPESVQRVDREVSP